MKNSTKGYIIEGVMVVLAIIVVLLMANDWGTKVGNSNKKVESDESTYIQMCKDYGKLNDLTYKTNDFGKKEFGVLVGCFFEDKNGALSEISVNYIKGEMDFQNKVKSEIEKIESNKENTNSGKIDTTSKEYQEFLKWKESQSNSAN